MYLGDWYKKRGIRFISERARRLTKRYGFRPGKFTKVVECFLQTLDAHGCRPTFAVPGIVVERNLAAIRRLQDQGAEIAVHGYNHVDLKAYPPEYASRQLTRAAEIFRASELEVHGFRCPYLSMTDELVEAIPPGVFEYSSNRAIQWPLPDSPDGPPGLLFGTIRELYLPSNAETTLSVPSKTGALLEIPVSVPDDLQLHDGLGHCQEKMARVWSDFLTQTYQRGELLNMMFHPELALFCESPFVSLLLAARSLHPAVWIAQLRDISSWWKEKSAFDVTVTGSEDYLQVAFACSDRATILARGLDTPAGDFWHGQYQRLRGCQFALPAHPRPFVGLPMGAPPAIVSLLREQGYIVETDEKATDCGIYIDEHTLSGLPDRVQLIDFIESAPGPLIRLWRWPDGYKSAMCITGDLDALSLFDYASRLFAKSTHATEC